MRWFATDMLGGLYAKLSNADGKAERQRNRLEDIRLTMLDMLGEAGAGLSPFVARRIRHAADAQALWYARADLMAALAELEGERAARQRMQSLTMMFDGTLPKGLMSRPTTLRQP